MSQLADLEKLLDLKNKGVITQQEFDQKKAQILGLAAAPAGQTSASPQEAKGGTGKRIGIATSVGALLILVIAVIGDTSIPKCDSSYAKDNITPLFAKVMQGANMAHVTAIDLSGIKEIAHEADKKRECVVIIEASDTEKYHFKSKFEKRADGQLFVHLNPIDEDTYAELAAQGVAAEATAKAASASPSASPVGKTAFALFTEEPFRSRILQVMGQESFNDLTQYTDDESAWNKAVIREYPGYWAAYARGGSETVFLVMSRATDQTYLGYTSGNQAGGDWGTKTPEIASLLQTLESAAQ